MKLFGKKSCMDGDKRYYFFGLPYLMKKKSINAVETYFMGIRISKRKLSPRGQGRMIENNVYDKKRTAMPRERVPKKFSFARCENPKVSIIMPVYNQYKYTRACLYSILAHTKDTNYEVIIADDNSSDRTKNISEYIENIIHVQNKKNLGFIKNCNNAAKYAKGDYIMLVNNDMIMIEGWLSSLVKTIDADQLIGAVGSKILNVSGSVQECGGIVYQNCDIWNFGYGWKRNSDEVKYVKEVDYISGCALMVRRDLWTRLNGFDEEFCPAYFEDVDFAFRVRKSGFKVVVQPKSEVFHFNNISYNNNSKILINNNREKFIKKWTNELHNQQCMSGQEFWGRDRTKTKKTLLFIDNNVPKHDTNCGDRAARQYLEFFNRHGFNVKFMPQSKFKGDEYIKYADELCQLGIEVLLNADDLMWLRENGRFVDCIYLCRPSVAHWYLPLLRKYTRAKIIYQAVDIHCVREQRNFEITKDPCALKSAEIHKAWEIEAMTGSHAVATYSKDEIPEVNKLAPGVPAVAVPLYILDTDKKNGISYNPANRSGIMFCGGSHGPNLDAVKWFLKDIFPDIKNKIPDLEFYVIGKKPEKEVQDLYGDGVIFTGYVSDEELDEYYQKCRLVVAPLRYGAGIKGKIIEAIYNKVPVVTTSIGAEGIASGILAIADSSDKFANAVIKLYNDFKALEDISFKSTAFINEHFSEAVVERVLGDLIDFPKKQK
ncbi:MAG: glycosyltransferase [Rickettsiales bacterium]|jgi:GT2 family glycosyltransferase|nr:glycosyltransferase [Rickettsiales bacterium]